VGENEEGAWGIITVMSKGGGRHGLGRQREGGGGDHLSSTGRSLGREDEGMSMDLEAVEEGGAPGRLL
jgi:hypothetical protein